MYKTLIALAFAATLNAEMVAGVSIVVKDKAITIQDIKNEMKSLNVSKQVAVNNLIRQKLEEAEIQERKITVESTEIHDDIKETAKRNNMSVSGLYEAALSSNGMTSSELKEQVKKKLLTEKLYASIAFSKATPPSESEMKEYFELHKEEFSTPSSFKTVVYQSSNQAALANKIANPMLFSSEVETIEREFPTNRVAPELVRLLQQTPVNSFSQIVPDGNGKFMSFYVKELVGAKEIVFEDIQNQIQNIMMAKEREQVLGNYFARLRDNADINFIRDAN